MQHRVKNFQAGQISLHYEKWAEITCDCNILELVKGSQIEFIKDPPIQSSYPYNSVNRDHLEAVRFEIKSLLTKKVIIPSIHEPGEFISPIFCVPKPNDKIRLILNQKKFNESVANVHFKMDNIQTVLKLITKNCWMASIDLKDAYYSVKVDPLYQKYLKFSFGNDLYQFTAFPNGLSTCPRQFTKLLKPALAYLRVEGYIIMAYIDDLYLQGRTLEECVQNVIQTMKILESLGFVVYPDKSVFILSHRLIFLGFVLDSVKMTVTLTAEKREKLKALIQQALSNPSQIQIRTVAQLIGHFVSCLPAVRHGALYYRHLDKNKTTALRWLPIVFNLRNIVDLG